jgi:hypothetical protein
MWITWIDSDNSTEHNINLNNISHVTIESLSDTLFDIKFYYSDGINFIIKRKSTVDDVRNLKRKMISMSSIEK